MGSLIRIGLADIERRLAENGANRLLHFACCATMEIDKSRLQEVMRNTEFTAVCGYRGRIDWMESAAFDLMLLSKIAALPSLDQWTLRSVKAFMKCNLGGLYQHLQFRMAING